MPLIFSDSLDGFTLFVGTTDYGGSITKTKLPMPKRTLKERRPGGTNMPVKTQHGWELENFEFTVAGISQSLFAVLSGRRIDQVQLMVRGTYTDEFSGETKTLEIELWGRVEEPDLLGEFEGGEESEGSFDFVAVNARCVYGDLVVYDYNARIGQCVVNDNDETESIRIALGRS